MNIPDDPWSNQEVAISFEDNNNCLEGYVDDKGNVALKWSSSVDPLDNSNMCLIGSLVDGKLNLKWVREYEISI